MALRLASESLTVPPQTDSGVESGPPRPAQKHDSSMIVGLRVSPTLPVQKDGLGAAHGPGSAWHSVPAAARGPAPGSESVRISLRLAVSIMRQIAIIIRVTAVMAVAEAGHESLAGGRVRL